MTPRFGDDRVGNFLTVHKDFSQDDSTFFVRHGESLASRARRAGGRQVASEAADHVLHRSHGARALRAAMKAGVEAWNSAFEAAGWVGAIRALDLPADADPEDIRYATLRWNTSDEPGYGAIGPSTVDPRTGEVLDADMLFEASMFAGFRNTWRQPRVGPSPRRTRSSRRRRRRVRGAGATGTSSRASSTPSRRRARAAGRAGRAWRASGPATPSPTTSSCSP